MNVKGFLKGIGKLLLAAVLAFAVLELFSRIYFNRPNHAESESGATDYTSVANAFYSDWTEGFGRGFTNNEGYNNEYDYEDGMEIDVLVMGSSFMQAVNVMQDESTAALLDKALENETVYNIGMSGHYFLTCAANLENAVHRYKPTKYIIIDTNIAGFSNSELEAAVNGETPEMEESSGRIVSLMKKSCFLKLIYYQMSDYLGGQSGGIKLFKHRDEPINTSETSDVSIAAPAGAEPERSEAELNFFLLDSLLNKMKLTAAESGAEIIIVYHPKTWLTEEGYIWVYDEAAETPFSELCEKNGIYVADMSETFMANYDNFGILPFGYSNTPVGTGHLNKNGHAMVAEKLLEVMEVAG